MKSIAVPAWQPKKVTQYEVEVPSSKSLANRVLVIAALTPGDYTIEGDFAAEDIQLMISALKELGVEIQQTETHEGELDVLRVSHDGSWMKNQDDRELFLGNSGTATRFLTSLLCLRKGVTAVTGKPRMKERPIADLVNALQQLGAQIEYLESEGFPPLKISPSTLDSHEVHIKGSTSSQYVTSLMLVAPALQQGLKLSIQGELISRPYVELTKGLMKQWGADVNWLDEQTLEVSPSSYRAQDHQIEGDASAAVYWWALAFLHGVKVEVSNVPDDTLQGDRGFLELLRGLQERPDASEEQEIDMEDMPDASLMLMAIAPLLPFGVRITGLSSLRVKETDRIEAMAIELKKLGVKVQTGPDWMSVEPLDLEAYDASQPIEIDTYDDHRVAMSMAILGTRLGNLVIRDPDCVAKTYPRFWDDLQRLTSD